MTDFPKECIIWGGGVSIKPELPNLPKKLKNKFVINTNYSFRHYLGTFLCFNDYNFYFPFPEKNGTINHPDIYSELKSLPLIIGKFTNCIKNVIHPNTILLQKKISEPCYLREKQKEEGWYCSNLTGIFALSLASYLMDYNGIIYLLGFDANYTGETHYYNKEGINHIGINNHKPYDFKNFSNKFSVFLEPNLKIYNVSPNSLINTFEKIDYKTFYKKLDNTEYEQNLLREEIRKRITSK